MKTPFTSVNKVVKHLLSSGTLVPASVVSHASIRSSFGLRTLSPLHDEIHLPGALQSVYRARRPNDFEPRRPGNFSQSLGRDGSTDNAVFMLKSPRSFSWFFDFRWACYEEARKRPHRATVDEGGSRAFARLQKLPAFSHSFFLVSPVFLPIGASYSLSQTADDVVGGTSDPPKKLVRLSSLEIVNKERCEIWRPNRFRQTLPPTSAEMDGAGLF